MNFILKRFIIDALGPITRRSWEIYGGKSAITNRFGSMKELDARARLHC
jgi:hypothetical protein